MGKSFVIHACLIFLTFCPGKSTNPWKKVIHNYKRDFSPQKRIYDWHKHEIEDYGEYFDNYEDYPNTEYGLENLDYDDNKVKIRKMGPWNKDDVQLKNNNKYFNSTVNKRRNFTKDLVEQSVSNTTNNTDFIRNISPSETWPKFEEILTEMGKKYDWKNDRWIKVKKKKKGPVRVDAKYKDVNTSIKFHEKHRFIYRIVRLNRPKSKRNIVLAVTAVR